MIKSNTKQCKYCGDIFTQKNKNHIYCSYDYKYKQSVKLRKDIFYKCSNCNIEYTSKNKKMVKIIFVRKIVKSNTESNLLIKILFAQFVTKL